MSTGKEPKGKTGKPEAKAKQKPRKFSITQLTVGGLTLLSGLLGAIAAVLAFLPRPTVSVNEIDLKYPFSAIFTVTNSNFIPLENVAVSVGVRNIVIKNNNKFRSYDGPYKAKFMNPLWKNHKLGIDEKITIIPNDIIDIRPNWLISADIAIVVTYEPWLLPFKREKLFRFTTRQLANGNFHWLSMPIETGDVNP